LATIRTGARAAQLAAELRDRFTRQPAGKALLGWQSYYRRFLEEIPGRALVDHRGPYLPDEARHTSLIDAIGAGKRSFLITAPPGCGKSRFALEFARRAARARESWDVRFVRHDEPTLGEELERLPQAGHRVLILDDAHESPALVQRLASFCSGAQGQSPTHLICLARPAGRAALTEALVSHFAEDEPVEMDLGRPNAKLIRDLIDKLIPHLSPHHRDVIRRFVADSFFAAVLLCSSVARQKRLPQTLSARNLRDYAVRQPIVQAIGDLCPAEKALRALAVYCACAPVRGGDATIRSCAAAQAALPVSQIESLERRILEAGLFEMDAQGSMQPVPDLMGDLILEEACLDEQGRASAFGQSLIHALFEQRRYEPVIRNCGDVTRLLSAAPRVEVMSELVLERARGLAPQSRSEALELLEGCASLVSRQPGGIVELVDALAANGILRAAPPARELSQADNLEVRAQRLLASAGERDHAIVPRALEYSRRLLACARADDAAHRALHESLLRLCQFAVARPLAHAMAVLDVLDRWVRSSDTEAAELAASLAHGFLKLEMNAGGQEAPTLASVRLKAADDVWKLRDRAIAILVRCAEHASPAVEHAAADSARHWALGYRGMPGGLRERWAPQLEREMDALCGAFGRMGSQTPHLPVRAAAEQLGWQWWTDGAEPFVRRGGKRILDTLPAAEIYSLWKALHAAMLPLFPVPLEEAMESQRHGEREPSVVPSAARPGELAGELFDRLDPLSRDPSGWSTMFVSVLSALPSQPLQPRAHRFLQEFVRRHPEEAWSFVSDEAAEGPLGAVLPVMLAELRTHDPQRWRGAIATAPPAKRLFAMQLGVLCAAAQLDSAERAIVAKGLQLEDAEAVHLAAQALLRPAHPDLALGFTAVFATLPARPADMRLWELTLGAFAAWGERLLSAPAGEEADPEIRAASGELLRLLRTCGDALSWDQGPHTRHLAAVLAVFAVAIPHTLKAWMRQEGSSVTDDAASESPLSPARMCEIVRRVAHAAVAPFWQKQFLDWITEEPDLAIAGARCLAQLCGLADPCVASLVTRIAQPSNGACPDALRELVRAHGASPRFVEDSLTLLQHLTDAPQVYRSLETEIISTLVRGERVGAGTAEGRSAALQALDRAHAVDLAPALCETLLRARRAIEAAMAEDLLGRDGR
jgi:hypothetical protein